MLEIIILYLKMLPFYLIIKNQKNIISRDFFIENTIFDLITAPALITAPPPLTFYSIFTYYCPLDDLFPDFLLYFHLLSPTWRSFGTSGREQIYVSAPGAY